jgi:hypothetical protein
MKGVMIDCSRLLERHAYYRDLIAFMAQWELNTLLFHFADDFGCAVQLPGFKHLAMPRAFTAADIRSLVRVWLCSESVLLGLRRGDAERVARYNRLRREVRRAAAADWDRTRFASDPQKRKPMFPNWGDQYLLHLLTRLPVCR